MPKAPEFTSGGTKIKPTGEARPSASSVAPPSLPGLDHPHTRESCHSPSFLHLFRDLTLLHSPDSLLLKGKISELVPSVLFLHGEPITSLDSGAGTQYKPRLFHRSRWLSLNIFTEELLPGTLGAFSNYCYYSTSNESSKIRMPKVQWKHSHTQTQAQIETHRQRHLDATGILEAETQRSSRSGHHSLAVCSHRDLFICFFSSRQMQCLLTTPSTTYLQGTWQGGRR